MDFKILKYHLKICIAYDFEGIFEMLKESINPNSTNLNEFIIHLSNYNELKQDEILGVLERKEKTKELNILRYSIMNFLDNIKPFDLDVEKIISLLKHDKYQRVTFPSKTEGLTFNLEGPTLFTPIKINGFVFTYIEDEKFSLRPFQKAVNIFENILNINFTEIQLLQVQESVDMRESMKSVDTSKMKMVVIQIAEILQLELNWFSFEDQSNIKDDDNFLILNEIGYNLILCFDKIFNIDYFQRGLC